MYVVTASVATDIRQSGTASNMLCMRDVIVAPVVSTSSTMSICLPASSSGRVTLNSASTLPHLSCARWCVCEGLLRVRRVARRNTLTPRLWAMPSAMYDDWL